MLVSYDDIISKLGLPLWYDNNGVPRYDPFEPHLITVYGRFVSLYEIMCQGCRKSFSVGHVWPMPSEMVRLRADFGGPPDIQKQSQEMKDWWTKINEPPDLKRFHYGDPPRHGCVGDTMNSIPIACLQHWESANFEWIEHLHGYKFMLADEQSV